MKKLILITLVALSLLDATARPSHAYLDPGAGSQLIQMSLAGVLGLLFVLKSTFQRLAATLRLRRSK